MGFSQDSINHPRDTNQHALLKSGWLEIVVSRMPPHSVSYWEALEELESSRQLQLSPHMIWMPCHTAPWVGKVKVILRTTHISQSPLPDKIKTFAWNQVGRFSGFQRVVSGLFLPVSCLD